MSRTELSKTYEPAGIEERWYPHWEKSGFFGVDPVDPRPSFSIMMPPPNVTGSLHMGHALDQTLQDILTRYHRMDGFAALWLPGTDHAGIATQNVVERELAKEKLTRHDLGREKFIERVWKWKTESGGKIVHQLRRLGASCDWSRERFTMDPGLSRAVRRVFVSLYEAGLIYRSTYLVSWCPRCLTALSDLEVEHKELNGKLTYFHYFTIDGERVTVATTRPETMLGDTAIAVHPDDPRYTRLVGKQVQHPFLPRTFPVIADAEVNMQFGTGAVKITPAHDPVDYEMSKRNGLQLITILNQDATLNAEAGPYAGLDRFVGRKKVVADLTAKGLVEKVEPYKHSVGHCQRCQTVVEPRISEQWFVKIAPLAKPAIEAVKSGKTTFVPEMWTKTYLNWMEGIRDWCISRQLWWGHQIPVWYCQACNEKTVAMEDPDKCHHCGSEKLEQDPDVLDTWFSSALWPFSTLGWPDAAPELKKFYPTTVLVTGFDIIFFWVARMMMMGLRFMNEVPFKTVHIHALVRDEKGQKMSKSKGNVVDPLEIMDRYGTDAFRFALTAFAAQGRDILLSEKRIEGYRNFINKIWNAARFVLTTTDGVTVAPTPVPPQTLPDRWIRTRLNETTRLVRAGLDEMRFNEAAEALYRFVWHEYCDWYLELIKPHVSPDADPKERESAFSTMVYVLDQALCLLHPIIPFVTEEIWQRLPFAKRGETIMRATFPKDDQFRDEEAVRSFEIVRSIVEALRTVRSENRIAPSAKIRVIVRPGENPAAQDSLATAKRFQDYLKLLARLETLEFGGTERPKSSALGLASGLELLVPLDGLVDVQAEVARLEKEKAKANEDREFLQRRLADASYREKAPPELIQKNEEKLKEAELRLEKITRSLQTLGAG